VSAAARILVVDDDAGTRETVRDVLEATGYSVETAARGAEGLDRVRRRPFDAAIVDIKLPDISGPEILQSLRAACSDIETIFITAYASLPTALQAINGSAFAYLLKPFEMDHLLATLKKALHSQRLARALHESEERYRLIAENIRDAIFLVDMDGRLVFSNRRGEEIAGYTQAEFAGRSILDLLTSAGAREAIERMAAAESSRDLSPFFETRLVRKDGSLVWVEANITSVVREGHAVGRLGVVRDITRRKRAEEQARLQATALEAAASGIVITDRAGRIIWTNPAFTHLTGWAADEAVGQTPRILRSGQHDAAFFRDLWETILAGRIWRGETVNRRKDGALYTEEQVITPVRDERGEISHFIAIKQDITERKRLEAQLIQSEKLAAMGNLLAGVAHELNNPLSVVTGHAAILRSTGDPRTAERAQRMSDAAERCARIVRSFLGLARQRPPERGQVRLNQVVREAVELLAYALRVDDVEVVRELAEPLPVLWADGHQLHQVVVNLVSNAHHALREVSGRRGITLTTRAAGDRRVVLEVADTGPGIPPEIRARLFEPFFTTKPPGQGTGLGLALCKGMIEAHGGTIAVTSEPGQGTVFRIELPVEDRPATDAEAPGRETRPPTGSRTILVVDDEPEIGELLAEMLAADGHEVETAVNGRAALDRLRESTYDVIISDIRMPELDGPGLYREIARRYPHLVRRLVFITGDTLGSESTAFLRQIRAITLGKPFDLNDVQRAIRQALQVS
jgi:two-component system NtrC family sensor kinase